MLFLYTSGMLKALCGESLSKVVMGKDHESQKGDGPWHTYSHDIHRQNCNVHHKEGPRFARPMDPTGFIWNISTLCVQYKKTIKAGCRVKFIASLTIIGSQFPKVTTIIASELSMEQEQDSGIETTVHSHWLITLSMEKKITNNIALYCISLADGNKL